MVLQQANFNTIYVCEFSRSGRRKCIMPRKENINSSKPSRHYICISVCIYGYAPYNEVSFNDGPHIRRWSHKTIIKYYNTYHCVTISYSIQYNNMLYVSLENFSVAPLTESCSLRSTQPLKVSSRNFAWGKGGRYVWLTTYHPCSAETSIKSGALIYPEPLGPPRPVAGDL